MLQLQDAYSPRRAFVEAHGDVCLLVLIHYKNTTRSDEDRGLQGVPAPHLRPLSLWISCLHPGIGDQSTIQFPIDPGPGSVQQIISVPLSKLKKLPLGRGVVQKHSGYQLRAQNLLERKERLTGYAVWWLSGGRHQGGM